MIGPIVRGRIGRNRGGPGVRSRTRRPVFFPPVPWQGSIARYLYPTTIADYESVSTGSWSTSDLYEQITAAGAPAPGADEFACYYHILDVPEESTDDVEVILDPIRYSLDEATVASDDFDFWLEGNPPSSYQYRDVAGSSPLSLDRLLPLSGNSHVSDGKPSWLRNDYILDGGCAADAWFTHGGWGGTGAYPTPVNFEVQPRYVRTRLNGIAEGGLIDLDLQLDAGRDYLDAITQSFGRMLGVTKGVALNFPPDSNPGFDAGFQFEFTAGDQYELDVWWSIRARPLWNKDQTVLLSGSGAKKVLAITTRHRVSDSARVVPAGLATTQAKRVILYGLDTSDGFDPEDHTYTVEFSTNEWHAGDGVSGAKKIEDGSGWSVTYLTSQGVYWRGPINGGSLDGKDASVRMDWLPEIAEIELTFYDALNAFHRARYRPQSSSDYVDLVNDRIDGAVRSTPSGVFNHLGSTTFELWHGTRPDGVIVPSVAGVPATITVVKVNQ